MLIQKSAVTVKYKRIDGIKKNYYNDEEIFKELFEEMRGATVAETESIKKYIQSISKDTGVYFFDVR